MSSKVERGCKREGCENTFPAYPSQNKVYCQPSCRYADYGIVLARHQGQRHRLTDIDAESLRATCSICGPVDIRRRAEGRKFAEGISWRCRQSERIRVWARRDGVPVEQVEKWIEDHDGKCAICKRDDQRLNVDHDHISGRWRGMLCNTCNGGLGFFKDDPALLRAAADYLVAVGG